MKFNYMKIIINVFKLLHFRHKKQFFLLTSLLTLSSIFEVAGVGSLLPFLSIITNPDSTINNEIILTVKEFFDINNNKDLTFAMGLLTIVLFVTANILGLLNIWFMQRFGWSVQSEMASKMFKENLNLPYSYFLENNSSDMTKNILYETETYLSGCLMPLLHLFAYGMTSFFIISLLAFLNFKIAFVMLIFFTFILFIFNYFVKSKLKTLGEIRLKSTSLRYKILSECFGAIKEIKVLGKENFFSTLFSTPTEEFSKAMAFGAIIKGLPRYSLEIIGFSIIISWLMFTLSNGVSLIEIIPMLGLYAIAGYRIMPAITRVYQSINTLQFHNAAVTNLIEKQKDSQRIEIFNKKKFLIRKNFDVGNIEFKNVSFLFKKSTAPTLNDISLNIPVFSTIALIGLTGAGKSTFINLMLGLIKPSTGAIFHRGKPYNNKEIINFQKNVGYVPQSIYLLDDTIKSNIALGVSDKQIDMGKIIQASKYAQIYDFISTDLENKFDTIVGEKGARLSGGQIQRIGIARAFYNEPKYIILDEATSNLDVKTESQFIMGLQNIKSKKTIIHVTHKSNVIKSADKIFVFDKGNIIVFDSYSKLINSNFEKLIS